MVLYSDEDNHGGIALRRKVEAFAQRGIQEYSYDTFKVKDWEYEVIDRATFPMPIDYVELVGMNYVDENGVERWLSPRKNSSNPTSPLQFNNTLTWDSTSSYGHGMIVKILPEGARDVPRNYNFFEATVAFGDMITPPSQQETLTVSVGDIGDPDLTFTLSMQPWMITIPTVEGISFDYTETDPVITARYIGEVEAEVRVHCSL